MNENKAVVEGKPAVFLDRDGVLCVEKGYVTGMDELEIFPYTKKCIQRMHQSGYLAVCITNQSAVARGMMEEETLIKMNDYLVQQVGLDAVYYCPHYSSGLGKYMQNCNCRKPKTGMIDAAVQEFKINRCSSYIVGDRATDIICGQNAGLKTVLLESGYGTKGLEQLVDPDYKYKDLEEFTYHQFKETAMM